MNRSKKYWLVALSAIAIAGGGAHLAGLDPIARVKQAIAPATSSAKEQAAPAPQDLAIRVTVARARKQPFVETLVVNGSLVARDEILIGPEIEGLRVLEVLVEEGTRVEKGQVLARLVIDTLEALLAQNDAALARASAGIAQARSSIAQAEARVVEAANAMTRAKPLKQSGYLSESVYDQREASSKSADAQLVAARDALRASEAEKGQIEAQRRELLWRRSKTEVTAPAAGIISRRTARVGAMAAMAAQEPMFRLIAGGQVELDAEVPQPMMARLQEGQLAHIVVDGVGKVEGRVRLISAEIDKATRLGRVRILLGDDARLRIGSFARGTVETARTTGLAVPRSAIQYGPQGATLQVIEGDRVVTRPVVLGLEDGELVEVRSGISEGDPVIAKAGTFLRQGDRVRPVFADPATASGS